MTDIQEFRTAENTAKYLYWKALCMKGINTALRKKGLPRRYPPGVLKALREQAQSASTGPPISEKDFVEMQAQLRALVCEFETATEEYPEMREELQNILFPTKVRFADTNDKAPKKSK